MQANIYMQASSFTTTPFNTGYALKAEQRRQHLGEENQPTVEGERRK
jgi:hypothetical protein